MIIDTARHPCLEPAQIEQAKSLYAAGGLSIKEIMKLTGIKSYDTFYKYVVVSAASHRAGRPKKITQAQIELTKSLYAAGKLSIKEIMKLTGIKSYLTFYKYVVEAGIPHRAGRPRRVTQAQIEQAKALYAAGGLSVKEIMQLTGIKCYLTFHKYVVEAAIHHRAGRPRKITQAQIEQAKALYAAGELSIKEIMKIVGFKSYNTFYKYVER
jgi:predicted DNA-binding transcriptional regulator AlpA